MEGPTREISWEDYFGFQESSFVDDANNISSSEIGNGKSRRICVEDELSTRLNIEDLPCSEELQVKVVILSEDGTVKVRVPTDLTIKKLICNLVSKEWKTVCNLIFKQEELRVELKMSLAKGISEEFESYFKVGTILQATQPDELAAFSDENSN